MTDPGDNRRVFLNIAFDPAYIERYLPPLMFSIEACSFTPFLALDHDATDREALISEVQSKCDLSINDVSPRWHGGTSRSECWQRFWTRTDRLPRYNGPYELGRFLARKGLDGGEVMVAKGPAALLLSGRDLDTVGIYFSDIRNRNCRVYKSTEDLVDRVRTWLNPKLFERTRAHAPKSTTIFLEFGRFLHYFRKSSHEQRWLKEPATYFFDLRSEMNRWLRSRPQPSGSS